MPHPLLIFKKSTVIYSCWQQPWCGEHHPKGHSQGQAQRLMLIWCKQDLMFFVLIPPWFLQINKIVSKKQLNLYYSGCAKTSTSLIQVFACILQTHWSCPSLCRIFCKKPIALMQWDYFRFPCQLNQPPLWCCQRLSYDRTNHNHFIYTQGGCTFIF